MADFIKCPKCGSQMKETARFCGSGDCDYEKTAEPKVCSQSPAPVGSLEPPQVVEKVDLVALVRKSEAEYKLAAEAQRQEVTEPKKEIINIPSKEEFNDYSERMEAEAKREIADYKKASLETRAGVPENTPKTSNNVLIAVIAGIIVISAGIIGGLFWYQGHKQATPTQPPVLAAPVPVTTTPDVKPAEPETPKVEVTQEPPKQPEPVKTVETPRVEPKKALKPNVATTKAVVKPKTEVTMPAKTEPVKVEPAVQQDVGHALGEVQRWLSSEGLNVSAVQNGEQIVLKGSTTKELKGKVLAKVKNYNVAYKDMIFVVTD